MKKLFAIVFCLFFVMSIQTKETEAVILVPVVDGTIFDFNDDNVSNFVNGIEGVQALNEANFDSRGIMEFDLTSVGGSVSNSFLRLYKVAALGPFPMTIDVYGYSADGVLLGEDYNTGNFLRSFSYNDEAVYDVDLTTYVQNAISNSYSFFGLNLRMHDQFLGTNAPPYASFGSLEWPSVNELHIDNQIISVVPEPATMVLLGGGLIGAALSRRKRS